MPLTIRPAIEADAEPIAALSEEMCDYLRELGDPTDFQFSADAYRRDGFGHDPAFFGLVAQAEGEIVGYLLYHFGYDCDWARRTMHIVDLYVTPKHRTHGVGRALMMQAQQVCRAHDAEDMIWTVYKPNELARAFYRRLGAKDVDDLDLMHLEVTS